MITDLNEAFKQMHLLSRSERSELTKRLQAEKPEFLQELTPYWWWYRRCVVNVLLVADGLDFSINGFGLSEFITTFQKLEQQSLYHIRYRVTLAHRYNPGIATDAMAAGNPFIYNRIVNFNFDTSVTLNDFDQVWLFGIDSGTSITPAEINKIDAYMNGGGGLFATGDHGTLGAAMGRDIPRVKDMRHWTDTSAVNDLNEVSMYGMRRNDTNRPWPGQPSSIEFENQSDDIPQQIAVRTFGGGLPHPLLSISTTLRPSGIIDIMPDHPHEGECKHETVFTVTNPVTGLPQNVASQIVATSFVLGGNTSGGKNPTVPHCFPSIAVFDGRVANVGRIVIDSTWHHFVNINLNGADSPYTGLTNSDFDVVQRYYMNIATWMTRRKKMLCWWRWIWLNLLKRSQLIESSLNIPKQKLEDIKLTDLNSIGMLAKEIIAAAITPAFAEEFMVDMIESAMPEMAKQLNSFAPLSEEERENAKDQYVNSWINHSNLLGTAVGAGFIALRDAYGDAIDNGQFTEEDFEKIGDVFDQGVKTGLEKATENMLAAFQNFSGKMKS